MLFKTLTPSAALTLHEYADIEDFRKSERYVAAESTPLSAANFSVMRASLALPRCSLSLVRTFPRIINGYEMAGRLVMVVPMDGVSSARVNGHPLGQSLLLLKGSANCTVYEPEARLVAILSIRPEALHERWIGFDNGYLLLRLPEDRLAHMQTLIGGILETAAREPEAIHDEGMLDSMQARLFSPFGNGSCVDRADEGPGRASLNRYKQIVDHLDSLLDANPVADFSCEALADEIGISVRTLQAAVKTICGSGAHHYSRLKRLWSVRRQLRNGAPGLTVKASALAHGFRHMSEFANIYRDTFGELPSQTLASARRLPTSSRFLI